MTNLMNYFVGPAGADMRIQAKALLYSTIGKGKYTTMTPEAIAFTGHAKAFGYDVEVNIGLKLLTGNKAMVDINGHELETTFKAGSQLVLTVASGPEKGDIVFEKWHNGAWINPDVANGHVLWIGP